MAKISPEYIIKAAIEYGQLRQSFIEANEKFTTAAGKMQSITQQLQSLEHLLSQLRPAYERSKEIEQQHPDLRQVIQSSQPSNTGESKLNSELYEAFQTCHKDSQKWQSLLPPRRDGGSTYELGPPRPPGPNEHAS